MMGFAAFGSAMRRRLPVLVAAAWWGSQACIGFLVVPLLFAHLPTPAQAGGMAAHLFTAQTWVGLISGLILLMALRPREVVSESAEAAGAVGLVLAAMLMALISEFGVAPHIVARENLALWHSLGSGLYLLQWLLQSLLLWRLLGERQAGACARP